MKLFFTSLLVAHLSYAVLTIEYLAVNHITKELCWAEMESNEPGIIGWHMVPEKSHHEDLQEYLNLGYTFTDFPFKLDVLVVILIIVILTFLIIRMQKARRSSLIGKR